MKHIVFKIILIIPLFWNATKLQANCLDFAWNFIRSFGSRLSTSELHFREGVLQNDEELKKLRLNETLEQQNRFGSGGPRFIIEYLQQLSTRITLSPKTIDEMKRVMDSLYRYDLSQVKAGKIRFSPRVLETEPGLIDLGIQRELEFLNTFDNPSAMKRILDEIDRLPGISMQLAGELKMVRQRLKLAYQNGNKELVLIRFSKKILYNEPELIRLRMNEILELENHYGGEHQLMDICRTLGSAKNLTLKLQFEAIQIYTRLVELKQFRN